MKNIFKFQFIFLVFAGVFLCNMGFNQLNAQQAEKNSVRLRADYIKIMDSVSYFNIKASARIDKENVDVPHIDLTVYNVQEDEEIELGTVKTNMHGECKFFIKDFNTIKPDSATSTYNFNIAFKGNDAFKRTSRDVSIKDASITANLVVEDSLNYVSASLKEIATDSVLSDQILNVQIQRLFRPLRIGEEFNITDENGTILVQIPDGIPGVDGNLVIEVVLAESDDYGTVKALINAPVGTPIVDESTFDKRTMWSPRNKTPIFLLIFPNLIIFGMWGLILYLFINLFKISKS